MQQVKARIQFGVQVRVKVGDYAESEKCIKSESGYIQKAKARVELGVQMREKVGRLWRK